MKIATRFSSILLGTALLAFTLVSNAQAATPLPSADHSIVSFWTPASGLTCPSSSPVSCISGQTLTLTPPTGGGSPVVVPLTTGLATYTFTPGGFLFCGIWTVSLVTNGFDQTGTAAVSSAVSATAVAPCPFVVPPATGLGVTAK